MVKLRQAPTSQAIPSQVESFEDAKVVARREKVGGVEYARKGGTKYKAIRVPTGVVVSEFVSTFTWDD